MNLARIIKFHDGETVTAVVRNHWLTYAGRFLFAAAFVALPFFLMIPLFHFGRLGLAGFALSLLVGLLLGVRTSFLWYWNAFIITNGRVIDIDQRGFFDRVVSEAPYDKIQDVSYRVKGVFGTLFNIGIVIVQTAGANADLELVDVHEPQEVQHLITRKMSAFFENQGRGERAQKLVATAAEMSDSEARAFVTELQAAMAQERSKVVKKNTYDGDVPALPDDWRDQEDSQNQSDVWNRKRI